jgi:hypothetical protein
VDWFPIGRAKCIELEAESEVDFELIEKIDDIKEHLKHLKRHLNGLLHK